MTISMDKKYRTRDGRHVVLYCIDAPGLFHVHGRIYGEDNPRSWTIKGKYIDDAIYPEDLFEIKVSHTMWIVATACDDGPLLHDFSSEEKARRWKPDPDIDGPVIAIFPVTFEEGQGIKP